MKTAISIPDGTFEAAERLANHKGISRSELYRTAIEEYLQRHDDAAVTERLNRVYSDPRNQPDKELTELAVEMLRRVDASDRGWYAEEKAEAAREEGRPLRRKERQRQAPVRLRT